MDHQERKEMRFRIREDLHVKVKSLAILGGVTVSDVVSEALFEYFLGIEEAWIVESSSLSGVLDVRPDEVVSEGA